MYSLISLISFLLLIVVMVRLRRLTKSNSYIFYRALLQEKKGNIEEAISTYSSLLVNDIDFNNYQSFNYDVFIRYSSCVLKIHTDDEISEWIYKYLPGLLSGKNNKKKDDVILEYILLLLKNKNYSGIPDLIFHHIYQRDKPLVKEILRYSANQLKQTINNIVDFINNNIDKEDTFFEIIDQISAGREYLKYFPKMSAEIQKIEPHLINKLLSNCNTNQYETLFHYLIKKRDFTINYDLMNNAAIIAERIIAGGLLTSKNYKDIISVFLTVVYNDNIFLYNLRLTEWDDNFGIYLENSSGFYNVELLPIEDLDNISNENHKDTIDVEKTRKFILEEIESSFLIYKESAPLSFNEIYSFYKTERKCLIEAINFLFELSDKSNVNIAFSPYFGYRFKLTYKLLSNMPDDITLPEVLDTTIPYIIEEYELDNKYDNLTKIDHLCSDMDSRNPFYNRMRTFLSLSYITHNLTKGSLDFLTGYPECLHKSLKYSTSADISKIEDALLNFKEFLSYETNDRIYYYRKLCTLFPQSQKIKIRLSNELSNNAIDNVNSKIITPDECVDILLEALDIYPKNYNAQKNITLIVASLAIKWATEYRLLTKTDEISNMLDRDMKSTLRKELTKIRAELKMFAKEGTGNYNLDDTVYSLIKGQLNNSIRRLDGESI